MGPIMTIPLKETGYDLECGYFIAWDQEKNNKQQSCSHNEDCSDKIS